MKHLFLLLCAAALCVNTTAGFYNHGHPLLMNMKTDSQELHRLHKRQENHEQASLCMSVIAAENCVNGFSQGIASFAQQCNYTDIAEVLQDTCRRNSNGVYCGNLIDNNLIREHSSVCNNSQTCSSECRNLLVSARNDLGCCIDVLNSTDPVSASYFAYSLWSGCNVEPVSEQCASTIDLPPVQIGPMCEEPAKTEHTVLLLCREYSVESIRARLSATEGCQDYNYPSNACSVDGNGVYCAVLESDGQNGTIASRNCNNVNTCDPLCIETLNNITNTVGCCFNDAYNTTTTQTDYLSYEFWSRCGLESPGFCEEFLNDAAVIIKASSTVLTLAVTAAVMLLWKAVLSEYAILDW